MNQNYQGGHPTTHPLFVHLSYLNPFPPGGTMWYHIIFKKKDLRLLNILIFFQCNSKFIYIFPNGKMLYTVTFFLRINIFIYL